MFNLIFTNIYIVVEFQYIRRNYIANDGKKFLTSKIESNHFILLAYHSIQNSLNIPNGKQ